jgi:hypothetical protein
MFRSLTKIPGSVWTHSIRAVSLAGVLALALMGVPQEKASAQVGQPALDFDGGTDWLNTGKPLKLADLRGRVVLLDFWTLC